MYKYCAVFLEKNCLELYQCFLLIYIHKKFGFSGPRLSFPQVFSKFFIIIILLCSDQ